MVKKHKTKRIATKKVFRNSNDIYLFEEELYKKEYLSILPKNTKFIDTDVTKDKYTLSAYYQHQKTNEIVRINPKDKDTIKHYIDKGYTPATKQLNNNFSKLTKELKDDSNLFFRQEIEPVIFNKKGKTSPSVPYLRVYVESSIGDNKVLHLINNKIRVKP